GRLLLFEELDGHFSGDPRVVGEVDVAAAAVPEPAPDHIMAEVLVTLKFHVRLRRRGEKRRSALWTERETACLRILPLGRPGHKDSVGAITIGAAGRRGTIRPSRRSAGRRPAPATGRCTGSSRAAPSPGRSPRCGRAAGPATRRESTSRRPGRLRKG